MIPKPYKKNYSSNKLKELFSILLFVIVVKILCNLYIYHNTKHIQYPSHFMSGWFYFHLWSTTQVELLIQSIITVDHQRLTYTSQRKNLVSQKMDGDINELNIM